MTNSAHKPLIAANWKMHGQHNWCAKPIEFSNRIPAARRTHLDVVICPPFPFLLPLIQASKPLDIAVGAQNCHEQLEGAYTGEVGAQMLSSIGTEYLITGHSERRAIGDTDAMIQTKVQKAQEAGLTPILCIGESHEQKKGRQTLEVIKHQLDGYDFCSPFVIAYEPLWAIGTGLIPESSEISEAHAQIREIAGSDVRILYGGSVSPKNAHDVLSIPEVDGVLVGGASLNMESFAQIAAAAL